MLQTFAMANDSASLLQRAQAGDRQALEALLEVHQAEVYRFGMKMCRDPEDAKDVLQETLLAMARGVREFRGTSSVSTWLYSIARSFCIKKRRRRVHAPTHEESLDSDAEVEARSIAAPGQRADDALAGKQVEAALESAIRGLDPMYREVLVLRDIEGLSAAEVAEVLGIAVPAVKSRLHRARASVRNVILPLLNIPVDAPAAPGICPDAVALFSQHLEGDLSANVCASMEKHLAQCPRCSADCDSLKRTLGLCKVSGKNVQVPAALQLSIKVALKQFLSENGEPT